jgi:hypothetical protein
MKAFKDNYQFLPQTFSIKTEENMTNFKEFEIMEEALEAIWIVKPGKNSNRGRGIRIFSQVPKIKKFL